MNLRKLVASTLVLALASSTALAQTGRQLTTDGPTVDNGDGTTSTPIIDTFWDERCAGNIAVTLNTNLLPNETVPGAPLISAEDAAAAVDAGLQRWSDNPSSFVNMSVENIGGIPPIAVLLDFVNQANFEIPLGAGTLGVSLSTSLMEDTTFSEGDDLDGDGDIDVFSVARTGNVCQDIDGDGDIEFPAGDYAAGTILDNDVLFSQAVLWETEPTATPGAADIDAVSTHEYGHSHGLTHSTINEVSAENGEQATMFPAIATFDPLSEFQVRTPSSDDLAASAFIYPEGSSNEGAAALQPGDIPFSRAFSILEGNVTNADGDPILSAAVFAVNRAGEKVAVTFSGEVPVDIVDIATGATLPQSVANSDFRLAVPARDFYTLKIESLDVDPVVPGSISAEALIAESLGLTMFPEETLDLRESSVESRTIIDRKIFGLPSNRSASRLNRGLDFILNEEITIENVPAGGIGASIPNILGAVESFEFIEQFDRDAYLAAINDANFLVGLNIGTDSAQPSASGIFSSVDLVTGTVDAETGAITLGNIVTRLAAFDDVLGQDGDATPLNFRVPRAVSTILSRTLQRDPDLQIFVVASIDDVTAVSSPDFGTLPLVRPIITGPESGTSFFTIDGSDPLTTVGVFGVPVNWDIQLRFASVEVPRTGRSPY